MPSLDARGGLGVAELLVYIPFLVLTFILTVRHGWRKSGGWVYLLLFSLVRIVGGSLMVAAELVRPVDSTLYGVAYALQSAGLSPLLLATLGFLGLVGNGVVGNTKVFRLLHVAATTALVLSIVSGTMTDPSSAGTSKTLRHVSVILFVALYTAMLALILLCWRDAVSMQTKHATLLKGMTAAMALLSIRILYTVLSGFSPSANLGASTPASPPPTGGLAKFNSVTGSWVILLFMGLLSELAVVIVYCATGLSIPRDGEERSTEGGKLMGLSGTDSDQDVRLAQSGRLAPWDASTTTSTSAQMAAYANGYPAPARY